MNRIILILLGSLVLFGCANRMQIPEFQLIVENPGRVFNEDEGKLELYLVSELQEYMSGKMKVSKLIQGSRENIKIIFLKQQEVFNRNWLLGNSAERKVDWELIIRNQHFSYTSSVLQSKDGALGRFVGAVTGVGSHPGKVVLPGGAMKILDDVVDKVSDKLQ